MPLVAVISLIRILFILLLLRDVAAFDAVTTADVCFHGLLSKVNDIFEDELV